MNMTPNKTQLPIFDTEQINDDVEKVLKNQNELCQMMNLEYQRKLTMITNISSPISNKNFGLREIYQVQQNYDEVTKIYYEIYKDLKKFFAERDGKKYTFINGKKDLSGSKTSSSTMVLEKDLSGSKTSSSTMVEKDFSGSDTGKRKYQALMLTSIDDKSSENDDGPEKEQEHAKKQKLPEFFSSHQECVSILNEIIEAEASKDFLIDYSKDPVYKDIIKNPMDLRTLQRMLGKGEIETEEEFASLLRSVFSNSIAYIKSIQERINPKRRVGAHSYTVIAKALLEKSNQLIDSRLLNPKKPRNSKINGMKLIPQDCPAPHLIENWWSSFNELKKIHVKKNTLLDCSQLKNPSHQYQWLRNQIQNLEDQKGTVFQDEEIRKEFQSFVNEHKIREKYCFYLPDGKMKILFKRPLGSKSQNRELSDSDSDISECEIDDDVDIDHDSDIDDDDDSNIDDDLLQSLLEFIKKNYRVNVNSAIDRTSFYNNYIANLKNDNLKTMITEIGKGRGGHKKPIGFIFDKVCKLQETGKIDDIITISNCGDYFQHYNLDRK